MTVQQLSATGATISASAQAKSSLAKSSSGAGSDFETFLKMLTTQIQNQDPLNPIDSSDYAVQLATFSGVEQQVRTNDLLSNLGGGSDLSGLSNLAGWVGMDARVEGSTVAFDGSPVEIHFRSPPQMKHSELVVSTPAGQELQRLDVTGRKSPFSWTGTSAQGDTMLTGTYQIAVEQTDAAGKTVSTPIETYARIGEVRAGSAGPEVVLADGRVVATSEVTALRGQ